ncbi:MAG: FG-GAP repeat protein [Actinobacteria bacterium]|nr:FG-GAP repeat protein [Actinomycetota bacterium]
MKRPLGRPTLVIALAVVLLLAFSLLPALAAPVEKDTAAGAEDSYMYGGNEDEIYSDYPEIATATGDVNDDGISDLILGHDLGGKSFPYLYTGKVYVYYGRTSISPDVDLGTGADVTINGWYGSLIGNSITCGDVNDDDIADIIIGAYLDSTVANGAGGVAVIFGDPSLPSSWDFNTTLPDLYMSSANAGELCGMSVAAGDIDGNGYDDIIFSAPMSNGGVRFYDGTNWSAQGGASRDSINDISMISNTSGWAVGRYISVDTTIYRTTDGTSWNVADTGFHNIARDLHGVSATDASNVWAVGSQGTIIKWGGSSWAQQTSPVTTTLRDVSMYGTSPNFYGWAVGDGGTILYYNSASWSEVTHGLTSENLSGVCAIDANNAWAVGDNGTILHYNGSGWSEETDSLTLQNLRSVSTVYSAPNYYAWTVGDGGTILYYNGSGWSNQSTGTTFLRGVSAVTTTAAWAVGDNGTVLKTTDGGSSWMPEGVAFSQHLNEIDATDSTHVWTVGEAATGRAYVVWGRNDTDWSSLTWSHADPIGPDLPINGIDAFDYCGFPVSAGDLNGDIYDDIVIGAFQASGPGNGRAGCGEAYVVNGRARGSFPDSLDLSTGANCTVYGPAVNSGFPTSVTRPLEDLNGDATGDLVFGNIWTGGPGNVRPGCGEVDVIFGGGLPAVIDLASQAPDVTVYGPATGAGAGRDVSVLDFDADGVMDLATGAPNTGKTGRPNCGVAWLVHGEDPWPAQVDLASEAGMVFYGAETNDAFGFCLASANLDDDPGGFDDLVISDVNGAGPGNARPYCGEHFLFLGYDFVPPNCTITNVADGSVLAGTVGVLVDAEDYYGIDRVEFRVDGVLAYTDDTAPYRWDWDTREYEDGATYNIEARAYDTAGNSASDARSVKLNNTIPPVSDTWYLAEGTTAWGFETYVLVQNPNDSPTDVTYTFMKPGGETQQAVFQVPENSRFTILVNSFVDSSDVSTRVEGSQPIISERAMYWTPQGQATREGGHDSIGVAEPSPTWYLAEGTTAWGFETYVLVQNPNPDAVDVTMTFMKPGGETQEYAFPVAGESRYTVNVNQVVPESDVSTTVEASAPVICERSMYRDNKALGHDSIGTPSTSRVWFLAEGTTAWGFDEYVLVQNPGLQEAAASVNFMLPDGSVVPYGILIPGQSRFTIHVDEVPGCEDTDLSTFISSNVPVICERAMYWQGASSPGGHDTIGTPLPCDRWYLAEGTTAWGFEEYVLVQNPNPEAAVVSFTFMKPDATTEFVSFPVGPNSRFSLRANDVVPDSDVSVSVLSDKPVICERAMYWGERNVGHVTIGVRGD